MVFHWSLSNSKSPQVSRTLLSILAVLNNAVIWMVSTRLPTSTSSSPFSNPFVTVPNAPITYWYNCHRHVPLFFQLPSKVEVLILLFTLFHFFSHSFIFHFYSVVSRDSKADYFASSLFLLLIIIKSEYENFVNAHLETTSKCIPTKLKTKYRVPLETLSVREKRALVKTASKNYQKTPTNTNARKLKTAQDQLAGIYIKEQTEYIQNQIDKIRDSVEDRQSRIVWQTIYEVCRRKSTAKAKLKAANQQERKKLWKQHFENLLGNPPKITHEPITRIIIKQLDSKLGPFTQEELDSVLRKIKNREAAGLDEIPPEVWKTRQFDDILLRHCNAVYNQKPIDRWMKGCVLPFPKKGGPRIS